MDNSSQLRAAAWIVAATAILSIILMLFHPIGEDTGGLAPVIHGFLQFVVLLQFAGLLVLARSFGFSFMLMIAMVFLGVGQLAAVLAATINGFVVPELTTYPSGEIGRDVSLFAWEFNQALARLGVTAVGIAYAVLGFVLWANKRKATASIGFLAGLVPLGLIISGTIGMDLRGAQFAYLTQAAFLAVLGWSFAGNGSPDRSA